MSRAQKNSQHQEAHDSSEQQLDNCQSPSLQVPCARFVKYVEKSFCFVVVFVVLIVYRCCCWVVCCYYIIVIVVVVVVVAVVVVVVIVVVVIITLLWFLLSVCCCCCVNCFTMSNIYIYSRMTGVYCQRVKGIAYLFVCLFVCLFICLFVIVYTWCQRVMPTSLFEHALGTKSKLNHPSMTHRPDIVNWVNKHDHLSITETILRRNRHFWSDNQRWTLFAFWP